MKLFVLAVIFFVLLSGCARQIDTGLSEQEAQEIVVTLRESGIDAYAEANMVGKKDNSTAWEVKMRGGSDTEKEAWKVLHDHGLPREKVKGLDEAFSNAGMIPTASEEKARLLVGLEGDLTRTLRSTPGVVDARVHVVLPDNTTLIDKKDQSPTTASVLVRYRSEQPPLSDEEIRGIVAMGVEGLAEDKVRVVQKKTLEKPLPPQMLGPLGSREWIMYGALGLAAVASLGAFSMLLLSKRRSLQIASLKRQLAQSSENSKAAAQGSA